MCVNFLDFINEVLKIVGRFVSTVCQVDFHFPMAGTGTSQVLIFFTDKGDE